MSIILKLQKKCLDKNQRLQDLLREAFVISSKLKLDNFKEWINSELKGYSKNIPKYRIITANLKFYNPYQGWIDAIVDDKFEDILRKTNIAQPISEIEKIIEKENIEIIHCVALYYGFLSTFLNTNLPIIYTTQGSEILIRSQNNFFYKYMAKRVFNSVDIVTNDSKTIQSAGFKLGAKKENNYIIQNGVDLKIFNNQYVTILRRMES